jgi:hypothetical protein
MNRVYQYGSRAELQLHYGAVPCSISEFQCELSPIHTQSCIATRCLKYAQHITGDPTYKHVIKTKIGATGCSFMETHCNPIRTEDSFVFHFTFGETRKLRVKRNDGNNIVINGCSNQSFHNLVTTHGTCLIMKSMWAEHTYSIRKSHKNALPMISYTVYNH